MLNGRGSVVHRRPLVGEASLQEVLLDMPAQILQMTGMVVLVRHLRTWSTIIVLSLAMEAGGIILARSPCSSDHSLWLLPRFGSVMDEVLHVSWHVEKLTGEAWCVLVSLRNNLVHANIEVLGLLKRRMILLLEVLRLTRRRSCAWNHWAHHTLTYTICLGELLLGLGGRLV